MSIDAAADELYGVPLDEFVSTRARLAHDLAGEDAKAVAKLRKPVLAAWALNQLARRSRRDVDLLLDAGHRLREAQAGVLRGAERDAFERARQTESEALKRLAREAESLLGTGASSTVLAQVDRSLRAAAVSEEGRELLARGRFVKPFDAASGFEVVAGLAGDVPVRARSTPAADERRRAQEERREARARLRDAEAAGREADREVERLRAELERAEGAAAAAQRAVEQARRALDR